MKKISLIFALFFWVLGVYAKGPLEYAGLHFFNPDQAPRMGIEIEISQLSGLEIVNIIQGQVGGTWVYYDKPESYVDEVTGQKINYSVREIHLKNSQIGDVVIKPEENSLANSNLLELTENTKIYEIVSEPISFSGVLLLQNILDELKIKGAQGTLEGHAVAIQVSVEMAQGKREKILAKNLIQILRNYLKSEHRALIASEMNVPDFRKPYLGEFSPGMMARLMDVSYNPTESDFYVDFMYRQALEILNYKEAWTAPERDVKRLLKRYLKNNSFQKLLPVYKWNFVRTSAVLMYLFPHDWLSRYLVKTTWFHDYPILEFREGNSDFDLVSKVKGFIGLVQYSESQGEYDYVDVSRGENQIVQPLTVVRGCFEIF